MPTTGQKLWSRWTRKYKKRMDAQRLAVVNRLSDSEYLQQLEQLGQEQGLDTVTGFDEALAQASFGELGPLLGQNPSDLLAQSDADFRKALAASMDTQTAIRIALGDSVMPVEGSPADAPDRR